MWSCCFFINWVCRNWERRVNYLGLHAPGASPCAFIWMAATGTWGGKSPSTAELDLFVRVNQILWPEDVM